MRRPKEKRSLRAMDETAKTELARIVTVANMVFQLIYTWLRAKLSSIQNSLNIRVKQKTISKVCGTRLNRGGAKLWPEPVCIPVPKSENNKTINKSR